MSLGTRSNCKNMGLYSDGRGWVGVGAGSDGLIIGNICASEIWRATSWEGLVISWEGGYLFSELYVCLQFSFSSSYSEFCLSFKFPYNAKFAQFIKCGRLTILVALLHSKEAQSFPAPCVESALFHAPYKHCRVPFSVNVN